MFLRNQWWAIAPSHSVRRVPVSIRRLGEDLVLWRDAQGRLVCQHSACPHRGVNLGLGRVVENCLECPYHGFRFGADGSCVLQPCEGAAATISPAMRVQTFITREAYDIIWLWWGEDMSRLPDIPWFGDLGDEQQPWADLTLTWDIPFVRAVEALLMDMHHFPFAHPTVSWLSGFSTATRLYPFESYLEGERIKTRGQLQSDALQDSTEDKAEKVGNPGINFTNEIYFPNLSLFNLNIGGLLLFVTATPIDEENTWAYARYYSQKGPAWLGRWLAKLAAWVELKFVQPDDYRLIRSSKPLTSGLHSNNFVRADKTIVLWHKLYQRHLKVQEKGKV